MSHHVTSSDIPAEGEKLDPSKVSKLIAYSRLGLVALGILSLILLCVPATRGSYSYSWLFAFTFFITLALGGCFWTLLHNLSNSGWGTSVRRLMENLGFVYPFLFLFSLPLFIPGVQKELYEWFTAWRNTGASFFDGKFLGFYGSKAAEMELAKDHGTYLLKVKAWYMNPVAWYLRMIFYGVGLSFVIWKLRGLSVEQDTDPEPGLKRLFKARALSAPFMPIFAVTATFLAFDILMALDFTWFSTMWGVAFFAGCALSSMATLILTAIYLQKAGFLKTVVTEEHFHIMGKLLFAFIVFWAYVSFSQFFLIWYANITEETRYFLLRNTENWNLASLGLVFLHFAVPFILLLNQKKKKDPRFMTFMCFYILAVHALDIYIMVIPERGPSLSLIHHYEEIKLTIGGAWVGDIVAFLTVGCGFLFFYLRNLTSVNLYPNRDPRILESANVAN